MCECENQRAQKCAAFRESYDLEQENKRLKVENERLRSGMKGDYDLDAWLEFSTGAVQKDADRYRWIRDKSEAVHQFYLSVPLWFTGVRFRPVDVDKAIDAMNKGEQE